MKTTKSRKKTQPDCVTLQVTQEPYEPAFMTVQVQKAQPKRKLKVMPAPVTQPLSLDMFGNVVRGSEFIMTQNDLLKHWPKLEANLRKLRAKQQRNLTGIKVIKRSK